jgi:hypothetical protein
MKYDKNYPQNYKDLLEGRVGDYVYDDDESIDTVFSSLKKDECELFDIETPNEFSSGIISEFIEKAQKAKATLTDNKYAVRKCAIRMRWHEPEYCDCDKKCDECLLALLEDLEMNPFFI